MGWCDSKVSWITRCHQAQMFVGYNLAWWGCENKKKLIKSKQHFRVWSWWPQLRTHRWDGRTRYLPSRPLSQSTLHHSWSNVPPIQWSGICCDEYIYLWLQHPQQPVLLDLIQVLGIEHQHLGEGWILLIDYDADQTLSPFDHLVLRLLHQGLHLFRWDLPWILLNILIPGHQFCCIHLPGKRLTLQSIGSMLIKSLIDGIKHNFVVDMFKFQQEFVVLYTYLWWYTFDEWLVHQLLLHVGK